MAAASTNVVSVLLVHPDGPEGDSLAVSIRETAGLVFVDRFASLGEAYVATEARPPDVAVLAGCRVSLPEFPMYAAMLGMLRVACFVIDGPPDQLRRVGGRFHGLSAADLRAGGGLGPAILRHLGRNAPPPALRKFEAQAAPRCWKTVVIGASTGGIEALQILLSCYPTDGPPTAIVQHIKGDFLESVAERLNRHCAAQVASARANALLAAGQVVLAPGNMSHLVLSGPALRYRLRDGPPMSGHRPSVDRLFLSAAGLGPDVVGVLLTGMGRDGAQGLAAIRAAGGWTIAQNAATSAVYGMPRAAVEMGAVCEELPIEEIGPALLRAAAQQVEAQRFA